MEHKPTDHERWVLRVLAAQSDKMNPDMFSRLNSTPERTIRAASAAKIARSVERCSRLSPVILSSALNAPQKDRRRRYSDAAEQSSALSAAVRRAATNFCSPPAPGNSDMYDSDMKELDKIEGQLAGTYVLNDGPRHLEATASVDSLYKRSSHTNGEFRRGVRSEDFGDEDCCLGSAAVRRAATNFRSPPAPSNSDMYDSDIKELDRIEGQLAGTYFLNDGTRNLEATASVDSLYKSSSHTNGEFSRGVRSEDFGDEDSYLGECDKNEAEFVSSQVENTEVLTAMGSNHFQPASADITHALFQHLATEPTDDSEKAAKFRIFEDLLENVVTVRKSMMQFWEQNKDQFQENSKAEAQQQIDAIDDNDSLIPHDDPSIWFVFGMAVKAHENSVSITNTLSLLRTRFELLSNELGECPMCLENMQPENVIVLGCNHKTCKACWGNWAILKGTGIFCPLCNHPAFFEEMFRAGTGLNW